MASTIEKLMSRKGGGKKKKDEDNSSSNSVPNESSTKTDGKTTKNQVNLKRDELAAGGYIVSNANSETVEEYRVIKRRLLKGIDSLQKHGDELSNLVLVTSALQGDGKTFTALNLALSMSMEMDKTALLIDGDVLKNGVSRTLGIVPAHGFIDLIQNNDVEFSDLVYKTDMPNLSIMPAGQAGAQATELFTSDRMMHVCREVASRYPDRIIFIDSPPLLQTTESQALAQIVPNIVFVVSSAHTPTNAVTAAFELLDKEKNINFVLNKVRVKSSATYYYYNTD